jgi:hypothetical protein
VKHELNIEDFELDEIVKIEDIGNKDTIDITVEDSHMFYLENGVYTHNSGLNAEVITMEAISEAFNKCFVADFIFSISRTVEDKQSNTGRIFIAKNRNGPDGIVYPISMYTTNVQITVLAPTGNEQSMLTVKDQGERLKERYKKFKKAKKEEE